MNKRISKGSIIIWVILAAISACATQVCMARKQRLTLPSAATHTGKRSTEILQSLDNKDVLVTRDDSTEYYLLAGKIRFLGYDKRQSANYETFLIRNEWNDTVTALEIQITYTDLSGSELHTRSESIKTELPPGTTRKADIKSWDTQKSFYYHKSRRPRTSATPYKVKFRIEKIGIKKRPVAPTDCVSTCGSSD